MWELWMLQTFSNGDLKEWNNNCRTSTSWLRWWNMYKDGVIFKTDAFLNSHCRPLLCTWMANMDFRLTIDIGKIIGYMTMYVTKNEKLHTPRTRRLFLQ